MRAMGTTTMNTLFGPVTIVADAAGAVTAAGFTSDLATLLPPPALDRVRVRGDLGAITAAVQAYLDGDLAAIDQVPVDQPSSGAFLDQVRQTLRAVLPGKPVTYAELAAQAGRPAAVRAAASACARNAVALFVPCHRVVHTGGGIGGYGWGREIKRALLRHEEMWAAYWTEPSNGAPPDSVLEMTTARGRSSEEAVAGGPAGTGLTSTAVP